MSVFNLAGVYSDMVHALAIIESDEDPHAVGDGEQAYGLLQQHPAFFQEHYGRTKAFPAEVAHSWADAEVVAAASFFDLWMETLGLDATVMAYNTGVTAYYSGVRNEDYLARFGAAYQVVRSGTHKCKLAA